MANKTEASKTETTRGRSPALIVSTLGRLKRQSKQNAEMAHKLAEQSQHIVTEIAACEKDLNDWRERQGGNKAGAGKKKVPAMQQQEEETEED
jgi:hypothetical protein